MVSVPDSLIVSLDDIDSDRLLEFWRWLPEKGLSPWFATALGDLFLKGAGGRVWWLDVGTGELQNVAASPDEFEELLRDPDNTDLWFGQALVDALRESGRTLGRGECYSYLQLPILGGEYEPGNFRVYDVMTHFRLWGPIHERLKDLPDGASVEFVVEEDDSP
jgi:hypothetical protein